MEKSPKVSALRKWSIKNNPLGLFKNRKFALRDIDPKPWSGHFNFLLASGDKKIILRFKGPEWREATTGIINEYEILKAVEKYKIGPKPYYLVKNFFGEPMLFEEYMVGKTLNKLSESEQRKIFPKVAKFIAKINKIKLTKKTAAEQEQLFSYRYYKTGWRERLKIVLNNKNTRKWGERIKRLLPLADKMLDKFEGRLKRVLKNHGPVFAFKSAHIGHCLKTKDGFRFFNWEKNGFGDPSYTLAVFLASIINYPDFSELKEKIVQSYLKAHYIPEFSELLDQRIKEREVSNLVWVLWAYANRGDTRPVGLSTGVKERFERVEKILVNFSKTY